MISVRSSLVSLLVVAFLVLVCACGDNLADPPPPDASPPSCCDLWPNVDAIAACAMPPPKSCGRMRCNTADGPVDIPVCGPPN